MVPKESRKKILDLLVDPTARNALRIHLAQADPAPDDADIELADLTECDFDDYAFLQPVWGAAALDGSFVASVETAILEWEAGAALAAPQTIYAVYGTRYNSFTLGYDLFWFERLDSTVTLANPGEKFRRVCKMQDTNYAP